MLALAQIALGVGLYLRTGPQVSRLVGQLHSDAAGFHAAERARMARVQRNFVVVVPIPSRRGEARYIQPLDLRVNRAGNAGLRSPAQL